MDFLTQRFIAFVRQFRIETRRLQDAIEEQTETIEQAAQTLHQQQPPPQIRAELHVPEAIENARTEEHNRNYRLQLITLIVSGITAIATAGAFIAATYYAHVTRKTLDEIKKQTPAIRKSGDAAAQALTQAEQHFRVEERPWIIAFPEFIPQTTFFAPRTDGTFAMGAVVQQRNIGKTPAVQAQNSPYDIIIGPTPQAKKKAMNFVPDYEQSGRFMMNPDTTMTAPIHRIERSRVTADELRKLNSGEFSLYIVGAIRYRDVFSPPIDPYETTYCFEYSNKGLPLASCPFGGEIH